MKHMDLGGHELGAHDDQPRGAAGGREGNDRQESMAKRTGTPGHGSLTDTVLERRSMLRVGKQNVSEFS